MSNLEKIINIIRNVMEVELNPDMEITEDMDLRADLHVDSLSMVMIAGDIEEEFGINVEMEEMSDIRTVEDILNRVNG